MYLSKLVVQNVGPFARPTTIEFEQDVTVLTGANDAGKSSILNLIEVVCALKENGVLLEERHVNVDRLGHSSVPWTNDREIACDVTFRTTIDSTSHVRGKVPLGSEITARCQLPPQCRDIGAIKWRASEAPGWSSGGVDITSLPQVIRLPIADAVRPIIPLDAPNAAEDHFLRAAFGPAFNLDSLAALTESAFVNVVGRASRMANQKLKSFLPPSSPVEVYLQPTNTRKSLAIQIRDTHESHTPIDLRGTGVQRLVSLMAVLLSKNLEGQHYIVLVDEPETSLHADSQHVFRAFLESISEKPNAQVVYATHSPSMINSLRARSLRLLSRGVVEGVATTIVENRPVDGNFLRIRSSLGITPSDSLLLAPVALILEGPTEVLSVPLLLNRLRLENQPGFENVGRILSHTHPIDGCGDTFATLCRIAISQGSRPVIFLDGDRREAVLNKVRRLWPEVPIVALDEGKEFEDLVPRDQYFASLQDVVNEANSDGELTVLTQHAFEEWERRTVLPERLPFSKRVDRWLQETVGRSLEKPRVMKHAAERVSIADINAAPLLRLLHAIEGQLRLANSAHS